MRRIVALGVIASALAGTAASAQQYPPQAGYNDGSGAPVDQDGYPADQPPPGYGGQGYQGQGYQGQGYQGQPYQGQPPAGYGGQPYQGQYDGSQGYQRQGYQGQGQPPAGYAQQPAPPPGYDGSQPPPPPPGYQAGPEAAQQADQDRAYAGYAQQWEQANCIRAHADTGTGAVLGGAVGALLGSGLAGRHDRGTGALLGAGVGAVGGAAIASSTPGGATSPGCPPGYVVRGGAPAFAYGGPAYYYAAPTWYQPWVFVGGAWAYRPYPYHAWYYNHYGWGGRGYYGRPGWRGGPRGPYGRRW